MCSTAQIPTRGGSGCGMPGPQGLVGFGESGDVRGPGPAAGGHLDLFIRGALHEVRSFWYPTWLAQPAALVPAAAGRRAAGRLTPGRRAAAGARLRPGRPPHQRALVRPRREGGRGAARDQPDCGSASWAPRWRSSREEALRASRAIDFVARNEFDFTIKEVAEGAAARDRSAACRIATNGRRATARPSARCSRTWTAAVRGRRLQARPRGRAVLHRLPAASRTSRSTPAAAAARSAPSACGRRPWAATATARAASARGGRDRARHAALPAGEGVLLRRRHLHRRPAARRGDRPRARQARRDVVVQRQGQRARTRR